MRIQVAYGEYHVTQERSGYTYDTDLEDLQIGDIVLVPSTPVSEHKQNATVVSLSSNYTGPTKSIIGLVRRKGE